MKAQATDTRNPAPCIAERGLTMSGDAASMSACATYAAGYRRDRRSGQLIILMTTSLFLLFSVMGLAIDLGYSYTIKIWRRPRRTPPPRQRSHTPTGTATYARRTSSVTTLIHAP